MAHLIGLDFFKEDFSGIVERGEKYIVFHLSKDGKMERGADYLKKHFRDYNDFMNVFRKFHPYMHFLKPPAAIKELTYDTLRKIWKDLPPVSEERSSPQPSPV